MASMEEVISELRKLRPEQIEEVARIIHSLSQAGPEEAPLPAHIVDEAVRQGWPTELFTELIGSLPEKERSAQPAVENRADL